LLFNPFTKISVVKKAATSVYFSTSGAFAQGEWGDLKKTNLP
tara:strand:- start:343 stop:468 length:126 start_codon:yes stop_codon:yes gene_type:complete